MPFQEWTAEIERNLIKVIKEYTPDHSFKDVMQYSLIPAGKYFRPLLSYALAFDLDQEINDGQRLLASSLEIHHTYTLIHDDLPAMDNDDMRRGRASSHIKFNEYQAILAGDALLGLSFELLGKIETSLLGELIQLYGNAIGSQGLILGQVMDLANENETLEQILKIHELKTARLIQLALRGSNLLAKNSLDDQKCLEIGYYLGINFQLLDDLCELTEEINDHEKEINPFFKFSKSEILSIIKENNQKMRKDLTEYSLTNLEGYINIYLNKIATKLKTGITNINKHTDLTTTEIKELT